MKRAGETPALWVSIEDGSENRNNRADGYTGV